MLRKLRKYYFFTSSETLPACWSRDAKQRPSFSDLLEWLERMKHSSILHEEDFSEMRMNWAQEIDREMVEKKTQSVSELILRENSENNVSVSRVS